MRDTYDLGDRLVILTTDRQSAFDRVLAAVPFKGQARALLPAFCARRARETSIARELCAFAMVHSCRARCIWMPPVRSHERTAALLRVPRQR